MEKIKKDIKLNYPLDWTYGVSIEKLKKDIEEIENLGATHVNIEHGISYDCSYVEIDVICRRIETDEEFEQRKKEVEARQEQYRQQELKQLIELKAKYDNLNDPEFQEKLFNEIKAIQDEIQGLAGYVQNDFERMLEDVTTTKKEINFAIPDMDKSFDKVIAELNQLREQARDIMKNIVKL